MGEDKKRVKLDDTLRIKITDYCNLSCRFCHNEGTLVRDLNSNRVSVFSDVNKANFYPGEIEAEEHFFVYVENLCKMFNFRKIHLTGGEPFLNKYLFDIAERLSTLGYDIKVTSNGYIDSLLVLEAKEHGISGINFSLLGLDSEEFIATQKEKIKNAREIVFKMKAAISTSVECGLKTTLNLLVSDIEDLSKIERVIKEYPKSLSIRILDDLSNRDNSHKAIDSFLHKTSAEIVENTVKAGSSSVRVTYKMKDGSLITLKKIRKVMPSCICSGCHLTDICSEGFYGLRLYKDILGNYKVGVCIMRMDLVKDIKDFLDSNLCEELIKFRKEDHQNLLSSMGR